MCRVQAIRQDSCILTRRQDLRRRVRRQDLWRRAVLARRRESWRRPLGSKDAIHFFKDPNMKIFHEKD